MKKTLLFLYFTFFIINSIFADWRMFQHDNKHSGYNTNSRIKAKLIKKWSFDTKSAGINYSSLAISDRTIFAGISDGKIISMDLITGQIFQKWNNPLC